MMNKFAVIALGIGCDMEAAAVRAVLEYFGFTVVLRAIGRPNDLIKILNGDTLVDQAEFIIFCFHGEESKFVMPELAPEVYEKCEPVGDFDSEMIRKFARFNGQNIIVTGCTLGSEEIAQSFLTRDAKTFIGTEKYVEGNAVIVFLTMLFYELSKGEKIEAAFEKAGQLDDETKLFAFFDSSRQ